jgi:hypothetical protein
MVANSSALVPLTPEQGTLVPVSNTHEAGFYDDDVAPLALLWDWLCLLVLHSCLIIRALQQQVVELRCQANYWRAQHQRAVQRVAALTADVQQLQGEIRDLKRRLFGRKSETSSATEPKTTPPDQNHKKRKRGQQPGSTGHGRRNHDHLPTNHET